MEIDVEKVIEENINLVRKMANKLYTKNSVYGVDDLIQTGSLNLLSAIPKYDPSRDKLSTFIYHCVRNSMIKFIKKNYDTNKLNSCTIESIPVKDFDSFYSKKSFSFFKGDVVYGGDIYYNEDEDITHYLSERDDITKDVISMKVKGKTQDQIKKKLNISIRKIKEILSKVKTKILEGV